MTYALLAIALILTLRIRIHLKGVRGLDISYHGYNRFRIGSDAPKFPA